MNTRARIATVGRGSHGWGGADENRAWMLALLDAAVVARPDLVCLSETFVVPHLQHPEQAETVPGPTTDAVAQRARKAGCYIVCPLFTRRDDRLYNSAVVLGRDGDIVGIYDKRHPVTSTNDYTLLENGVTPGTDDGVFDLDFGRVGIRICFDIGFPDDWALLARRDVRLVLWPSAYDGGRALEVYAALHRFFVTTAVSTERARIIDPCGTIRAATDRLNQVVWQDINLDFALCHYDFNFAIPDRLRADFGDRVALHSHVPDGVFLIEPTDPTVTIAALRERLGFETAAEYFDRHRAAEAALAQAPTAPAQIAAHGTRPIYAKG